MPISTTCPTCKALFRLAEELAGRTVKCQKCQSLFVVPQALAEVVAPAMRVAGESASEPEPDGGADAWPLPPKAASVAPPDRPVTAQFAERDRDDEDRSDPEPPRRSPRRPRRDEPPVKPRSKALPIVLALVAVSVVLCLVGSGAGLIWFLAARGNRAQQQFAQPNRNKQPFMQKGIARRDQEEAARLAAFVPAQKRTPAPTTEIKLGPTGVIRVESKLTKEDPLNADRRRHKNFTIRLEAGKKYQIDLESPLFDTLLILVDDANKMIVYNDDIQQAVNQNSRIIFTPNRTAVYKLEATFWLNPPPFGDPDPVGAFDLTVRELK